MRKVRVGSMSPIDGCGGEAIQVQFDYALAGQEDAKLAIAIE